MRRPPPWPDGASLNHVLVTGGAGFIGSTLCAALLARGNRVTCLDDFSSGARRNLAGLERNPAFELVTHDVCEPFPPLDGLDAIFNLACPASPRAYQRDPVRTMRICVVGALNALETARAHGATILQASTSEVYGDPLVHPQREDYRGNVSLDGPRACYDEGKRAAETLFLDYARQHGVGVKIARIFNTYGPNMGLDDGRVIPTLVAHALRGEPMPIHGDGGQTRCFCFVDDMVDGLMRLMAAPADVTGPVNLGSTDEITILDLARIVREVTGSNAAFDHLPLPPDDPTRRRPDIGRARALIGWEPVTPLRTGIAACLPYFRAELAAASVLSTT